MCCRETSICYRWNNIYYCIKYSSMSFIVRRRCSTIIIIILHFNLHTFPIWNRSTTIMLCSVLSIAPFWMCLNHQKCNEFLPSSPTLFLSIQFCTIYTIHTTSSVPHRNRFVHVTPKYIPWCFVFLVRRATTPETLYDVAIIHWVRWRRWPGWLVSFALVPMCMWFEFSTL